MMKPINIRGPAVKGNPVHDGPAEFIFGEGALVMKKSTARKQRILETDRRLEPLFPDPKPALLFSNPLELLVATILSAQCTDERVNIVTRALFRKYHSPADYAHVPAEELEGDIRPTGFFRNKAKSIQGCCAVLLDRFRGRVPGTMEELLTLPGVGRKTANVILGAVFGVPGIIVDTHVKRLVERLDFSDETDPDRIESDLMPLLPSERWTAFSHELVFHGRAVCKARRPDCSRCVLRDICPWPEKTA